jgi:thiosulfate dehydrogenase
VVYGAPEYPSEPWLLAAGCWLLAAGGRIYDDWASAPDRAEPEATCPAYPVAVNVKQEGYGIWRC